MGVTHILTVKLEIHISDKQKPRLQPRDIAQTIRSEIVALPVEGCEEPETHSYCPSQSKCKDKVHPPPSHKGPEGQKIYNSTLSSTSALDGVGC
jgi:hypothetical protein